MNSIINKLSMLSDLLVEHSLDLFGVAETWLLPDVPDSFVSISQYNIVRADTQCNTRKHGVCIYIKNSLNFVPLEVNCTNTCAIYLLDLNLYVVIVYRPPSNSNSENLALVDFLLDFCPTKEVLLMGDFNLPNILWRLSEPMSASYPPLHQQFVDCFLSLGLYQWVKSPTFIHSGSTLDLILTSEDDRVGDVETLPNLPSCGHCPLILQYYFQTGRHITSFHQVKHAWHRGKYIRINSLLQDIDWEFEFTDCSCDQMFSKLRAVLSSLTNLYVPVAHGRASHHCPRPPASLKARRKNAWIKYKSSRTTFGRNSQIAIADLDHFNAINNRFRNYHIYAQIDYESSLSSKVKSAPKLIHQYIRSKKVGAPSVGPLKSNSGRLTADCGEMAELFATKFSQVYTTHELSAPLPHQRLAPGEILTNIDISIDDVRNVISSLESDSSMGPDGIHPCLLKSCTNLISPLHMIFKQSLREGRLPANWKRSTIVPIFKKGSRHIPLNYRPISLTSVCCKSLEKLIAKGLYEYLESHNALSSDQFGFRRGRTVDDQLLLVYNDVTSWVDSGYVVDIVLFDFSKAFDVVCHTTLVTKLKQLGIGGRLLDWISDFLIGRSMSVSVSGISSTPRPVHSGVPQGSVLGPLLFLIYVNYIPSYIKTKCKFFADDLKLYMKIRHDNSLPQAQDLSAVQRDIDSVHRVASSWGLNFNPAKCALLRCHRGTVDWLAAGALQYYHLENSDLNLTESHKDLGILIDNSLKFHAHIKTTVGKTAGLATNLLRTTHCRSAEFMMTIFKTHIRPVLEFGSPVWNTGYIGDLKLLESVQRRWTKHIDGLSDQSYADRLKTLNLYSVQGRLLRADLIKCWKIFNNASSISPQDLFCANALSITRGHRHKIAKPHTSTECRRRFFSVRVIDHWNTLPDSVVSASSVNAFKQGLHQALGDLLFSYID